MISRGNYKFCNYFFKSWLDLIYPRICLHCSTPIEENQSFFCLNCLSLLELIQPEDRCSRCFSLRHPNKNCNEWPKHSGLYKMGAAFDYIGPASSLIKKFKYNNQTYLGETIAAFLIAQWAELKWPIPDIVIPVPLSFTHWIGRRYNQSALLAESFAKAIQRPMQDVLIRRSGDYSQAGLKPKQRIQLTAKNFRLKKGVDLQDKVILLIDDVMTTGATLHQCSHILLEGYPSSIYALTACKTSSM